MARILYSSDWSGVSEIYAVDPAGRLPVAQLTFGRPPGCDDAHVLPLACGYTAPLSSPDGRLLLYRDVANPQYTASGLWVARADGREPHLLVSDGVVGASWAPDSRQIAFLHVGRLSVVNTDGTHARLVAPLAGQPVIGNPAWSPDGRSLAVPGSPLTAGLPSVKRVGRLRIVSLPGTEVSWSPDNGRIAYVAEVEVEVASSAGTPVHGVGEGDSPAWSPDGRTLAFEAKDGTRLFSLATGKTTLLTRDGGPGSLAWAPDGRSLAYLSGFVSFHVGDTIVSTGDLRIVPLSGHARTVVAADRAYGGRMLALAWTRPPATVRYRPAAPAPRKRVEQEGILADGPIEFLAADGDRVAFATTCSTVSTWTPRSATSTLVRAGAFESTSLSPICVSVANFNLSGLALSDHGVAWVEACCNNSKEWSLKEATLETPPGVVTLGAGSGGADIGGPSVSGSHVDTPVGAGPLLVFSSWQSARDPASGHYLVVQQSIQRAGPTGCPCANLRSDPGPLTIDDVDQSRIVAHGTNAIVVLDGNGSQLTSVPVSPAAVALTSNDLIALVPGELRDYNASNGTLVHTWPLPNVPSGPDCPYGIAFGCPGQSRAELALRLQDAAHGLIAYVLNDQVHLLRLADGKAATFAPGTHARFMNSGLVYSYGSRIHLVPYERLPLR